MLERTVRILVADDHELFRKGIISLIIKEPKIRVIGEANDGKDLVYKYFKLKPKLVLTDISMPEISGIEAASVISKKDPNAKIIFLSMYEGEDYIYHCLKSGGSGLIHKNINKQELIRAIEVVVKGNKYFGKEYSNLEIEKLVHDYENQTHVTGLEESELLTDKEKEVLLLIAEGLTSTEIAERLYVGKRTIDSHRINIMLKLKLKSLADLIKYAMSYSAAKEK